MKVLVAQRKGEKKLRYYNGRQFVIGKNRAVDVGKMNTEETINKYIEALYKYLETTPEAGTIDYFTSLASWDMIGMEGYLIFHWK